MLSTHSADFYVRILVFVEKYFSSLVVNLPLAGVIFPFQILLFFPFKICEHRENSPSSVFKFWIGFRFRHNGIAVFLVYTSKFF